MRFRRAWWLTLDVACYSFAFRELSVKVDTALEPIQAQALPGQSHEETNESILATTEPLQVAQHASQPRHVTCSLDGGLHVGLATTNCSNISNDSVELRIPRGQSWHLWGVGRKFEQSSLLSMRSIVLEENASLRLENLRLQGVISFVPGKRASLEVLDCDIRPIWTNHYWLVLDNDTDAEVQITNSLIQAGIVGDHVKSLVLKVGHSVIFSAGSSFISLLNGTAHVLMRKVAALCDECVKLRDGYHELQVHDSHISGGDVIHVRGVLNVTRTLIYCQGVVCLDFGPTRAFLQFVQILVSARSGNDYGVIVGPWTSADLLDVTVSGAGTGVTVRGRLSANRLAVSYCKMGVHVSEGEGKAVVGGAVVLNEWANVAGIADYRSEETHTQLLPAKFCGLYPLLLLGLASWGLGAVLLEWALKMHFLHTSRAKQGCFGATIFLAAGLGLGLWMLAAMTAVQYGIDSLSARTAAQYKYDKYGDGLQPNWWWVFYGKRLMIFCGFTALATFGYLYIAVGRRIKDFRAMAELREAEKLMKQKNELVKSLDNLELRKKMAEKHKELFQLVVSGNKAEAEKIFLEMQDKAKAENERLATWFGDRRGFYASESHGKRLKQLEAIESVTVSELVQPRLPESIVDEKSAIDFLYRTGSWLRGAFKQELQDMCKSLNSIKTKADAESLGLSVGFHELKFDPTLHPLQPNKQAEVGEHVGLLLAPIKAKERAMDKAAADYANNPEKPAARYVCDFLRATVFASDPFVLAVAFDQLRKRFEVVRVKNKFRQAELNPELRTNILVNLWVRNGDLAQIGEVQFLLQDYLTAKDLQHLYYDVVRAKDPGEIIDKPIFG